MEKDNPSTVIAHRRDEFLPALHGAIQLWAESTTSASDRYKDLVRDKRGAVESFFLLTGKHPAEVKPRDVREWREAMEAKRLKPNTVYAQISRLSSFYRWAMKDAALGRHIKTNPALLARPKRPGAYQTGSTKSLTDEEMNRLLAFVQSKADAGSVVAKRDYALLLLYFLTGLRRNELISLRGTDVELKEEGLVLKYRRKGGKYGAREVLDAAAVRALVEYLRASDRMNVQESDRPLWTRHDRSGRAGTPLSSHSFVKNLKAYAGEAGIKHIHLHQTRHTFARIFSEDSGSMTETQEALDHEHVGTTRAYVQTIAVKKDKSSGSIRNRIG
ncbi:MAG: tyrosine-type recombinase/integrase [Chitinophagaceae bacterium]